MTLRGLRKIHVRELCNVKDTFARTWSCSRNRSAAGWRSATSGRTRPPVGLPIFCFRCSTTTHFDASRPSSVCSIPGCKLVSRRRPPPRRTRARRPRLSRTPWSRQRRRRCRKMSLRQLTPSSWRQSVTQLLKRATTVDAKSWLWEREMSNVTPCNHLCHITAPSLGLFC